MLLGPLLAGVARGAWWQARFAGLALGLSFAAGFALQTVGLTTLSSARSALLTTCYVIFTPFLEALVLRRQPTKTAALGSLTAFAGAALMTGAALGEAPSWGDLLTLGGALAFALQLVVLAGALSRHPSLALLWWQILGCGAFCCAALPIVESPRFDGSAWLWWYLAILILGSTLVALYLQNYGQSHTSPSRAAVLFATEPIWAAAAGLVLGQVPTWREVAGGVVILIGATIAARGR